MRDICQINGSLSGFDIPLQSHDTDELSRARYEYARSLAGNITVVYIRGKPSSILSELRTLIERN